MKFDQLVKYNLRNIFPKFMQKIGVPDIFLFFEKSFV